MDLETVLMQLEVELVIIFAIGVPVMIAHHAFRLGFDTKTHQVSKATNEKSLMVDILAMLLTSSELYIENVALPYLHLHGMLALLLALIDFVIIFLAILLETITLVDYFRNKKKLQKNGDK